MAPCYKEIIKKGIIIFLLLVPVQLFAAENCLVAADFSELDDHLDLQSYIEILPDPSRNLTIDDFVGDAVVDGFKPVSVIGDSFGFSTKAYWICFTLHFDDALSDPALLQLEYPLFDNVSLFVPDGQGGFNEKISGDAVPFSQRDVNYRNFLFVLPEHSGETRTYYMRVQTDGSTQIALSLWTARHFIENVDRTNIVLGLYYGIMLILVIAALASFIKIRDRLFLYYALYLSTYLVFQLSLNGLSYQYLWPEHPWFTSRATSALVGLVVIAATFFSGSFLQVWTKKNPLVETLFYMLIIIGAVSAYLSFFGDYEFAVQLASAAGLFLPPVVLIGAVASLLSGYRPARYFILAWGIFVLGVFITGLMYAGFLPHNFITSYAIQIGSIFEIILLGYALMDRVDQSRSEKDRAIERANGHISTLYDELEGLVDERTKQLSKSEAHLRTLIETLPDLVWWKDPHGVYMGCNSKVERLLGAEKTEIIGKTDYDFMEKGSADLFRERDQYAATVGTPCIKEEEVTYVDDGHVELLETIKVPMLGSDDELIGVLGVGRDITARRRSEHALLNTQKMEAIGQLTGGIAHDFNNILAIVIGNLSLLKVELSNDKQSTKRIEAIEKSANRAADLTKQLLGFSRKKAEQQTVTNINRLIGEMDSLIARSLTPQVKVTQELSASLWTTEIDQGDFQDAIINLVINARDAMVNGGNLRLVTENRALEEKDSLHNTSFLTGEYVVLTVSDDGCGMTAEQQEHIFEPFFTTKEQGKGTGLGLAMVFGFVNRSKGFIDVISAPDTGTAICIYMPRCLGKERQLEDHSVEIMPQGNEIILVVDDEEMLLELAQDALEALGYTVITASNGKQALEQLASEPAIDMLISDVLMPGGMNGYELVEIALASKPSLKVLLASGYTSDAELGITKQDLSIRLLAKPYKLSALANYVRETLDE